MDIQLMEKIRATSSRLEKEALLAQASPDTLKFLKWAIDPIVTFGITADEQHEITARKNSQLSRFPENEWWTRLDDLLGEFQLRNITGNSAANYLHDLMLRSPSELHVVWACRVVNRDLDCGVQLKTLNNVFPGAIEPFSCMLAREYDPDKHEIDGAWIAEPKMDGLRMVVMDGTAYTRNGRTVDTVGHVLRDLEKFKDEYVFDGEIMGQTEFNEDSGKTRRKGVGEIKELKYHVFDCIRRDEWLEKKTRSMADRKSDLLKAIPASFGNIVLVDWFDCTNGMGFKDLEKIRNKFVSLGFEGMMLKDKRAPYEFKRAKTLLKFKPFKSADAPIVGYQPGKKKYAGMLGAIVVDVDGVTSEVGSGFTDAERIEIWKNKEKYLGKMVEVRYQEKSPEGKLRFSSFMKFRPDKD